VKKIRQGTFDTVLLELFLKDCMGYEIISGLKLYQSGIKIITMTRQSTPELEKRVRQCGIVFYMEKPVPLVQLKQILDQLLK
jgi:DNA-binding NtrC family response regulator